jgi:hypothetical protein
MAEPPPTAETSDTLVAQDPACTMVEIYPGYPGYRGFVAGLAGPGEVACLEQLQRQFPWFDRDREDQENAAAAVRLGLAGGPKDWVWENWLAIEAERGSPLTCYICAREQFVAGEPYQAGPADPNDIRLLVGTLGASNELVFQVAARHNLDMWKFQYVATTDYQLRALAWTANAPRHLNAWELHSVYDAIAEAIAAGQGVNWPAFIIALTQGGYAPTPPNAAYEDQLFLVGTALESQALSLSDLMARSLRYRFDALVRSWTLERATGSTQGLGEFLCPNFQECASMLTQ